MAFYGVEFADELGLHSVIEPKVFAFDSAHERDTWVKCAPDEWTPRAAVPAKNPIVRRARVIWDGTIEYYEHMVQRRRAANDQTSDAYRRGITITYDEMHAEEWKRWQAKERAYEELRATKAIHSPQVPEGKEAIEKAQREYDIASERLRGLLDVYHTFGVWYWKKPEY